MLYKAVQINPLCSTAQNTVSEAEEKSNQTAICWELLWFWRLFCVWCGLLPFWVAVFCIWGVLIRLKLLFRSH